MDLFWDLANAGNFLIKLLRIFPIFRGSFPFWGLAETLLVTKPGRTIILPPLDSIMPYSPRFLKNLVLFTGNSDKSFLRDFGPNSWYFGIRISGGKSAKFMKKYLVNFIAALKSF